MTDIKDIIHLYLGCEVNVLKKLDVGHHPPLIGQICEITRGSNHGDWIQVQFENCVDAAYYNFEERFSNFHTFFIGEDQIKPILRRLDSLTESEYLEVNNIWVKDNIQVSHPKRGRFAPSSSATVWLLSKGFWIFGDQAFEDGSIIEKTVN